MLTARDITTGFFKALENMADRAKLELAEQGHRASGRGIDSIEAKITEVAITRIVGVILANDYLIPVDTGVPAARVPFSGVGGGGTSKYIQGLINWINIIKPGLSAPENKSFAFAIAYTHKKQGIPTSKSYAFSKNGRRTGWIAAGLAATQADFEKDLEVLTGIVDAFENALISGQRIAT